ncbi:hypothetical protein, partial [Alistipes finegoldii]|uniref:hypothetical protein n=1 Tax=Alistipes finegoldii TaxID=214856 RepID=UPI003AB50068
YLLNHITENQPDSHNEQIPPADSPERNYSGHIRRGIPQKIRTGIGIPEKLPIFADTISHESGSAAGGPDSGFHTGCNEKGAPPAPFMIYCRNSK